ncbi:PilW family protein [Massilia sp. TS11]|uniref:PilW family protein n=1 Tax=Massilia sp. TS11 TaxID=2908003 RepID=UPI001EDB60DF|nr:PilW family protein [Massilia sp. TS11]MCG2584054.1 PilW family protein [Massilia sp. TS11]
MRPVSRQAGFSLVELMVAAAIGIMILAGMITLFVNNNKAQSEIEKANRQIENGRFSIELISTDLRNAGYLGEFDPTELPTPTTAQDVCATAVADLVTSMPLHVQGFDATVSNLPSCLSDVKAGTDILVVRRARGCVVGVGSCDPASAGGPFFQASLCNNSSELGSGSTSEHYRLDLSTAGLDRHERDCASTAGSGSLAPIHRYQTNIYFIANNSNGSDGIPTLKRAELGVSGSSIVFSTVALVEGVENLQFEYGLDTNNDGAADTFTPNPASYGGCTTDSCSNTNWRNVVAVRMHVLARNLEQSPEYIDGRSYVLGKLADGSDNTIPAAGDHYKRHVFQALIGLPNPAGRKAP